jgi:ribonuclease HI
MVIVSRIEYRTQLTILTKQDCHNIVVLFRKTFKHKLGFSSTIPNSILENRYIYNFRDLYEVQLQSKITNFFIQLNDRGLLGCITNIRIQQLQMQEWLATSPLHDWPYNELKHYHYKKFIAAMITLCKINGFSFQLPSNQYNKILGGNIEIRSILSQKDFISNRKSLQNNSIMFLDQITTINGTALSEWKVVKRKSFTPNTQRTPRWFTILEQSLIVKFDGKRLIQQQYITPSLHFKGNPVIFPSMNNGSKPWVTTWIDRYNMTFFGKVIAKNQLTQTVTLEHWIIDTTLSLISQPVIKKCTGCNIFAHDNNDCIITTPFNSALIINTIKKINENLYLIDTPLYEITQLTQYNWLFMDHRLNFNLGNSIIQQPNPNLIYRFVESGPIRNQLISHQNSFSSATNLTFYTDGSVINLETEYVSMSSAYLQTNVNAPNLQLSFTFENWPSSSRAELAAVVAALLVAPPNSNITIYTDSASVISCFKTHDSTLQHLPRNIMKSPNYILWLILYDIIKINNLTVDFIKVKAHSGDVNNEAADTLAKISHGFDAISLNFNSTEVTGLQFIPLWYNIPVDTHLRHFITDTSREKGFESWLNLYRNNKYRHNRDVDWYTTFFILQDDIVTSQTSFLASHRKASKIKFLTEELATVEHIKKRRPDLYSNWYCPSCNNGSLETFSHIWACPSHTVELQNIYFNNHKLLVSLVNDHLKSRNNPLFSRSLDGLSFWSLIDNSNSLTFIDLIKGIVPTSLTQIVNSHVNNIDKTRLILSIFFNNIYLDIMFHIWKPRCDDMLRKEQHLGLSKKLKKQKKPLNYPYTVSHHNVLPSSLVNGCLGLQDSIRFGGNFLDFMVAINWFIFSS